MVSIAGHTIGTEIAPEDLEGVGPIDLGGLLHVGPHGVEIGPHQEHRQRQRPGGPGQDQRPGRVEQAHVAQLGEQRDGDRRRRQQQPQQHDTISDPPSGKLQPREGECRRRGAADAEGHRHRRNEQRVEVERAELAQLPTLRQSSPSATPRGSAKGVRKISRLVLKAESTIHTVG